MHVHLCVRMRERVSNTLLLCPEPTGLPVPINTLSKSQRSKYMTSEAVRLRMFDLVSSHNRLGPQEVSPQNANSIHVLYALNLYKC